MAGESDAIDAPGVGGAMIEGRSTEDLQRGVPPLDAMIDLTVEAFETAAAHEHYGPRMEHAGTSIALDFGERAITVWLDRSPIEVSEGFDESAESSIRGTKDQWMPIFVGGNIGIALARGDLDWSGPVRKFLRIFPIFRNVYAKLATGSEIRSVEQRGADPELEVDA